MKIGKKIYTLFVVLALVGISTQVIAMEDCDPDKTLSPYFLVLSEDTELDQLPLKSTSAKVNISGVIADVVVTQIYKNEGQKTLEAIYIFPASTRAALYGMRMTIGERTIIAEIKSNKDARTQYEQAKQEGRSASLLEQKRPNVFQMNVANILPSDEIYVELKYTELLVPTDKLYEFIYPTVVGPRYSNRAVNDFSEDWIANPYLHEGHAPTYAFNISMNISTGVPIQELLCTSHNVQVQYNGSTSAVVELDESEGGSGNRDFILRYRLAGGLIETGLLLYEGRDENFFLLMMQPPQRLNKKMIPPREYIFIVDVSGSMHGFPLNVSKKLLTDLIGNLQPKDRFNVLLFAGGSTLMSEQSIPATQNNIRHATGIIDNQRGGGGTELLPALNRALSLPCAEGFSRSIIIVTDGYVAVEEEAFDVIRANLGNANMFAFGIGSSVNRYLIEGMARAGMGEPFIITKPEEAFDTASKFRRLVENPVLTDIEIDFDGFDVYDVEPQSIPDVLSDRPVIVFGKYKDNPHGTIQVRGMGGDQVYCRQVDVTQVNPMQFNSSLRYLWARHKIALLSDYNTLMQRSERIEEITNLGLEYNLLTAYTSFVAVDTQVRLIDGNPIIVRQPLPLPQGVTNYAVGQGSSAKVAFYGGFRSGFHPGSASLKEANHEIKIADSIYKQSDTGKDLQFSTIELKEVVSSEVLTEKEIRTVIMKNMSEINRCSKYISKKKGGDEEISVHITTDSQGKVKKISWIKGMQNEVNFRECFEQELKKLYFHRFKRAKDVKFSVTFIVK